MEIPPKFLREKYQEVTLIGQGADGHVYKCTREGTTTAVKVISLLDTTSQDRYIREVASLRQVNSEYVVKILDAGNSDGYFWYESEYANQGHFGRMYGYLFYSDLDRVNYFRQICLGVQALHESNPSIIHRDLKPSNILVFEYLNPRRTVLKIADFGSVRLVGTSRNITATGDVLGTAHYIAPEQENNPRAATPRSDIYSLGIVFLEACTGYTRPLPENLNHIPDLLRPIVERMVRQNPRDRYISVREVIEAFDSLSHSQLIFGREIQEGEPAGIWHASTGREIQNALEVLHGSNKTNVLQNLEVFERRLDLLGDACDDEADTLMRISQNVMATINEADIFATERLVQRFLKAAEQTSEKDHFSPVPDMWARFLADTFVASSYRATKSLCLEGLSKFLVRFGSAWTKNYLYLTITHINDPSYMEDLAEQLCKVGREDIADLIKGVPDERDLDLDALRIAIRGTE